MSPIAADTATWIALAISAVALIVSIVVGVLNAHTARQALSISRAEHDVRLAERAALRMNIEPINLPVDPVDNAYFSEGNSARVRLRIEMQTPEIATLARAAWRRRRRGRGGRGRVARRATRGCPRRSVGSRGGTWPARHSATLAQAG
jgi:hypothetical protein